MSTHHKHTPGPWHITRGNSQMCDDGTTIWHRGQVGVYSSAQEHGEDEADARLISAAPDLLDALECIARQSIGDDWTAEQAFAFIKAHAREAIAKVRA